MIEIGIFLISKDLVFIENIKKTLLSVKEEKLNILLKGHSSNTGDFLVKAAELKPTILIVEDDCVDEKVKEIARDLEVFVASIDKKGRRGDLIYFYKNSPPEYLISRIIGIWSPFTNDCIESYQSSRLEAYEGNLLRWKMPIKAESDEGEESLDEERDYEEDKKDGLGEAAKEFSLYPPRVSISQMKVFLETD